jgi:predicted nucleic acid-binding protein
MDYLIDTDILVDYLRQNPQAIEYLKSVGNWSYSVVTAMELFAGARDNREVAAVERFLDLYPEVALSEESGRKDARSLRSTPRLTALILWMPSSPGAQSVRISSSQPRTESISATSMVFRLRL